MQGYAICRHLQTGTQVQNIQDPRPEVRRNVTDMTGVGSSVGVLGADRSDRYFESGCSRLVWCGTTSGKEASGLLGS